MKETAYRLLIVDDDRTVREGLADIVDWKSCGFQVVAALKDGEEGIRYLERHQADVVLSDIRMTFVSGLSLARHVYERRWPTKVVLISGYQEFELAKEALRYNVSDYLLKPTDLDEVYRVFGSLRQQLDREREERARQEQGKEQWDQMRRDYRERFLPHLLFRTSADAQEIRRQFGRIGMSLDPAACACARIRVDWASSLPAENVQRALLRGMPEDSAVLLLPLGEPSRPLQLLAVSAEADPNGLEDRLGRLLGESSGRLKSLIGVACDWTVDAVYAGLTALLDECRAHGRPADPPAEAPPPEAGNQERERRVITQAKQYVNANLKKDLTLNEVADQVYLNPVYLGRLFKSETGRSFTDYVASARMELAAHLVRNTNLKIYEICEQVGYKDVRHFYKLFRKHTGHLPREYRERRG